MKTVFILSISSDIGLDLASRYLSRGYHVIGTYRTKAAVAALENEKNCALIKCDLSKQQEIVNLGRIFSRKRWRWDVFISCAGNPLPVVSFFESKFNEWATSVHVNSIAQLQALHVLHPYRSSSKADVVFFAGGGANGAVLNFSAYTISKIMLTKMCEFLDAENKDLNIFIIGPGWTRTKIHETILSDSRTDKKKVLETKNFLKTNQGTPFIDIFDSIEWLRSQKKEIVSGRNFSVVHDPWKKESRHQLVQALKKDANMYKLRRHGNLFMQ